MNPWILAAAPPILLAFLIGSIPFGYLAGKLKGIDIREHGSGNIGATNAIRVLGKGIGIPVFVLDVLKGTLPVLFGAWWIESNAPVPDPSQCMGVQIATVATAIAAILGHNFTPWLGFKGGKGIATSGGALLGFLPIEFAFAMGVWILFAFLTRYVSVASIAAAIAIPTTTAIRDGGMVYLIFGILIGALAIWRHKPNIQRLLAGTENKIGAKKKQKSEPEEEEEKE